MEKVLSQDVSDDVQYAKTVSVGETVVSGECVTQTSSTFPRDASEDEIRDLRHVVESVSAILWFVAFTGAAQRFAYWGAVVPWQNYIQNAPGNPLLPGALGLGQSLATTINNAFLLFGYLTPCLFAILSDSWLGRYKTLLTSLILLIVGCAILFVTSLPAVQVNSTVGIIGLVVAFVFIGLGQGAAQIVIYPLLGDQLPERKAQAILTKRGEIVVTDRSLTIQYIFNVYYWMVNVAGLSSMATTLMEKRIGFWAAYLLPLCFLVFAIMPLIIWNNRLVKQPPQDNVLLDAAKVCLAAIRGGFSFAAASPMHHNKRKSQSGLWSLSFVDDIRRAVRASRIIFCFVIFWLCYNQIVNNVISQAGQMRTGNVSNDTIQALNPIACIVLGPLIQKGLFPLLARHRVPFGPVMRMTTAFVFIALGMGYAAFTQQLIYSRGPCYHHPLECTAALTSSNGDGERVPNDISVWVQVPLHFILGVGEILGIVSLSEYAYAQAPAGMKALLQSLELLTAAVGAAIGMALGPVSRDPWLVIMYGSLAGVMGCSSLVFWILFRKYDEVDASEQATCKTSSQEQGEVEDAGGQAV